MNDLTPDRLIDFLKTAGHATKNQLAQAFRQKGDERIGLKQILKDLTAAGRIVKTPSGAYAIPRTLPQVGPLTIMDITLDGEIWATPPDWDEENQGPRPMVDLQVDAKDHATLTVGDRVLARTIPGERTPPKAKMIRRLIAERIVVLGELTKTRTGLAVRTLTRRDQDHYDIAESDLNGAQLYQIVRAEITTQKGGRTRRAQVIEILGRADDPKIISLVALHEVGLRAEFPAATLKESQNLPRPTMGKNRTDLRDIPLVTIDGEDARDFDDAVFAQPDEDHPGGFHLMVAIADVSHYVRASSALDQEAFARGNSTYFPDRVLPMLPEALSNDLCSLRPKEDRYTLAVHLWIDAEGNLKKYKFVRGVMKSIARLTYNQVQAAQDGTPDAMTDPLMNSVIRPLYRAYKVLLKAREARGTLDLDLPERKIKVDETGAMTGVALRERLDSHRLIEEFMILANVAAALALTEKNAPCVFRIHDRPGFEKLNNLKTYLTTFGMEIPSGTIDAPKKLVPLLTKAKGQPYAHLVHDALLRSQAQARYSTDNIGHFGLALTHYAHFTSPIRRYADLLVHRSLIRTLHLGEGGLSDDDIPRLEDACEHISTTERASAEAERSATDRFCAAFLSDQIGAIFSATIASVTRFGLFVRLTETGADGLIPIRLLSGDFYEHDDRLHALIGRRTGTIYRLGAPIDVELLECEPLAGSLLFRPADDEGADIPGFELQKVANTGPSRRPPRGAPRGKPGGKSGDKPRNSDKKGPRRGKPAGKGGREGPKPSKGPKKPGFR